MIDDHVYSLVAMQYPGMLLEGGPFATALENRVLA